MHIGLIGGIGPAATDFYYRGLISALKKANRPLELTITHADAATLINNLELNKEETQAQIFRDLSHTLKRAGAQAVAITSIGGHFCLEKFKPLSAIPVLDMLTNIAEKLEADGYGTVGILGTETVMRSKMYGRLGAVNVVSPQGDVLQAVHQCYIEMATSGSVTEAQRDVFFECGRAMSENQDAEIILLGGTDLLLAFDGRECGFNTLDCAQIHIDALAIEAARAD